MSSVKIALAVTGAVALGLVSVLVAAPFGAPAAPATAPPGAPMPQVSAEELIASVRDGKPVALAGTVWMDARLGPAASSMRFANGTGLARLWSDGAGRRRVSLPGADGERTIVDDGTTVWDWSSATRSVTRTPSARAVSDGPSALGVLGGGELLSNPTAATAALLGLLAGDSMARVEPMVRIANRDAYQLVLAPVPTERTTLREIRVAVDTATRLPLEVSVLANGLAQPALRVGFSQVSFGQQDPALFRFTPARRVAVHERQSRSVGATLVGRGWDTVLVRRMPEHPAPGPCGARPGSIPPRCGAPIDGPWGRGRVVNTPIGSAVLTSDGRLATGAVPVQVVTEALGRSASR